MTAKQLIKTTDTFKKMDVPKQKTFLLKNSVERVRLATSVIAAQGFDYWKNNYHPDVSTESVVREIIGLSSKNKAPE